VLIVLAAIPLARLTERWSRAAVKTDSR
jgi:hypothetical protein